MMWYRFLIYLKQRLSVFLTGRLGLYLGVCLAAIVGVTYLAVLIAERNIGSALANPLTALWWVIMTIVGITDPGFFPITTLGRIVGIFLNSLDILFLGLFSALFVSAVIDFLQKEAHGMLSVNYKGHILICGWNQTAKEIIGQLLAEGVKRPLVLLARLEENPLSGYPVYFIRGDPTRGEDLERANIREADAAIIFPMPGSENPDAQSLLTAFAIEAMTEQRVYTCVEIVDPRNREHFARAHVDEVIAINELGAHLLARSTLYKGLATLVSTLLYNDEDNELYKISLPNQYVNKTFDEVLFDLRTKFKIILLAIEREGRLIINPKEEFFLQEGDNCLVISWGNPLNILQRR